MARKKNTNRLEKDISLINFLDDLYLTQRRKNNLCNNYEKSNNVHGNIKEIEFNPESHSELNITRFSENHVNIENEKERINRAIQKAIAILEKQKCKCIEIKSAIYGKQKFDKQITDENSVESTATVSSFRMPSLDIDKNKNKISPNEKDTQKREQNSINNELRSVSTTTANSFQLIPAVDKNVFKHEYKITPEGRNTENELRSDSTITGTSLHLIPTVGKNVFKSVYKIRSEEVITDSDTRNFLNKEHLQPQRHSIRDASNQENKLETQSSTPSILYKMINTKNKLLNVKDSTAILKQKDTINILNPAKTLSTPTDQYKLKSESNTTRKFAQPTISVDQSLLKHRPSYSNTEDFLYTPRKQTMLKSEGTNTRNFSQTAIFRGKSSHKPQTEYKTLYTTGKEEKKLGNAGENKIIGIKLQERDLVDNDEIEFRNYNKDSAFKDSRNIYEEAVLTESSSHKIKKNQAEYNILYKTGKEENEHTTQMRKLQGRDNADKQFWSYKCNFGVIDVAKDDNKINMKFYGIETNREPIKIKAAKMSTTNYSPEKIAIDRSKSSVKRKNQVVNNLNLSNTDSLPIQSSKMYDRSGTPERTSKTNTGEYVYWPINQIDSTTTGNTSEKPILTEISSQKPRKITSVKYDGLYKTGKGSENVWSANEKMAQERKLHAQNLVDNANQELKNYNNIYSGTDDTKIKTKFNPEKMDKETIKKNAAKTTNLSLIKISKDISKSKISVKPEKQTLNNLGTLLIPSSKSNHRFAIMEKMSKSNTVEDAHTPIEQIKTENLSSSDKNTTQERDLQSRFLNYNGDKKFRNNNNIDLPIKDNKIRTELYPGNMNKEASSFQPYNKTLSTLPIPASISVIQRDPNSNTTEYSPIKQIIPKIKGTNSRNIYEQATFSKICSHKPERKTKDAPERKTKDAKTKDETNTPTNQTISKNEGTARLKISKAMILEISSRKSTKICTIDYNPLHKNGKEEENMWRSDENQIEGGKLQKKNLVSKDNQLLKNYSKTNLVKNANKINTETYPEKLDREIINSSNEQDGSRELDIVIKTELSSRGSLREKKDNERRQSENAEPNKIFPIYSNETNIVNSKFEPILINNKFHLDENYRNVSTGLVTPDKHTMSNLDTRRPVLKSYESPENPRDSNSNTGKKFNTPITQNISKSESIAARNLSQPAMLHEVNSNKPQKKTQTEYKTLDKNEKENEKEWSLGTNEYKDFGIYNNDDSAKTEKEISTQFYFDKMDIEDAIDKIDPQLINTQFHPKKNYKETTNTSHKLDKQKLNTLDSRPVIQRTPKSSTAEYLFYPISKIEVHTNGILSEPGITSQNPDIKTKTEYNLLSENGKGEKIDKKNIQEANFSKQNLVGKYDTEFTNYNKLNYSPNTDIHADKLKLMREKNTDINADKLSRDILKNPIKQDRENVNNLEKQASSLSYGISVIRTDSNSKHLPKLAKQLKQKNISDSVKPDNKTELNSIENFKQPMKSVREQIKQTKSKMTTLNVPLYPQISSHKSDITTKSEYNTVYKNGKEDENVWSVDKNKSQEGKFRKKDSVSKYDKEYNKPNSVTNKKEINTELNPENISSSFQQDKFNVNNIGTPTNSNTANNLSKQLLKLELSSTGHSIQPIKAKQKDAYEKREEKEILQKPTKTALPENDFLIKDDIKDISYNKINIETQPSKVSFSLSTVSKSNDRSSVVGKSSNINNTNILFTPQKQDMSKIEGTGRPITANYDAPVDSSISMGFLTPSFNTAPKKSVTHQSKIKVNTRENLSEQTISQRSDSPERVIKSELNSTENETTTTGPMKSKPLKSYKNRKDKENQRNSMTKTGPGVTDERDLSSNTTAKLVPPNKDDVARIESDLVEKDESTNPYKRKSVKNQKNLKENMVERRSLKENMAERRKFRDHNLVGKHNNDPKESRKPNIEKNDKVINTVGIPVKMTKTDLGKRTSIASRDNDRQLSLKVKINNEPVINARKLNESDRIKKEDEFQIKTSKHIDDSDLIIEENNQSTELVEISSTESTISSNIDSFINEIKGVVSEPKSSENKSVPKKTENINTAIESMKIPTSTDSSVDEKESNTKEIIGIISSSPEKDVNQPNNLSDKKVKQVPDESVKNESVKQEKVLVKKEPIKQERGTDDLVKPVIGTGLPGTIDEQIIKQKKVLDNVIVKKHSKHFSDWMPYSGSTETLTESISPNKIIVAERNVRRRKYLYSRNKDYISNRLHWKHLKKLKKNV